jgi:hypothetical protein
VEGGILLIVDMSEEEWWKAEQGGVVFLVPPHIWKLLRVSNLDLYL